MAEERIAPKPITDEIATTAKDIDVFAGWINRLENPDPVLRSEAGGKGLRLYDEVARDTHSASELQTRYLAVAGREWEVLPASERRTDQRAAELVTDAIKGVNFSLAVQELLRAILYGFYVAEVMWGERGGRWMPVKIMGKHPRRFIFDMDRRLRLLTPENMSEGEVTPDRKFIVFTWGSSDNPYGDGLGQKLWWPVWFKKHGVKWWGVFLEKFGQPTPVGKYPPGTDSKQQKALLDALDAIQTDTGIKIPNTMVIEFLEATRTGQASYEKFADYWDGLISRAVLGQTLTSGGEEGGSYALGKVHEGVRQDIVKADADLLCETLNATLVKWIVDFNLSGVTEYPQLWIRVEAEQDLKELAERDKILLVDMGLGKRVPESYAADTYGLPLAEEGEPTITPPRDMREWKKEVIPPDEDGSFVEGDGEDVTPIDPLTDRMTEEAAPAWAAILDHVRGLVDSAPDLPALRDALLNAYAELPSEQLAEVMTMGFAAAELAGRFDLNQESQRGRSRRR